MITGIVVALPEEVNTLTTKRLKRGEVLGINDSVWLICSGTGKNNAARAAQLLIDKGAGRLVSWGCAAGISAAIKPGDLILASRCITADQTILISENEWNNKVQSLFSAGQRENNFQITESSTVISTREGKVDLARRSGADAVDMESVAVASIAKANRIPFLIIRAIADPLQMDLPKAVSHALNGQGEISHFKLMAYLLMHPFELPGLIRLGFYFNDAKKTLKRVAGQLDAIISI